jgi:hypothetical protein
VIKNRVAMIVFNNKEAEKLVADIKEKIAWCRIFRNGRAEGV